MPRGAPEADNADPVPPCAHEHSEGPGDGAVLAPTVAVIQNVRLYQFTDQLDAILSSRSIWVTWLSPMRDERTVKVLWLTANPDPEAFRMKLSEPRNGVLTVEVPNSDVVPWSAWRDEIRPKIKSSFEASARAFGATPSDWYVMTRDVTSTEWTGWRRLP